MDKEGDKAMNDRELLTLAAKAAGIEICWPDRGFPVTNDFSYLVERNFVGKLWNPLADDGDALRLAVKLKMIVPVCQCDTQALDEQYHIKEQYVIEEHNKDHYAATRRAIVLAAAEIGKGMK